MTKKELQQYIERPIIKERELISKVISAMISLPADQLYCSTLKVNDHHSGRVITGRTWCLNRMIEHLQTSPHEAVRKINYPTLQKYTAARLLKTVAEADLEDNETGWVYYLLGRVIMGFAYDMKHKTELKER